MAAPLHGTVGADHDQADADLAGRVVIADRALKRAAEATASAVVGVPRDRVSVAVVEYEGGYRLSVAASLPIADLSDTAAIRAQVPVLERASQIQAELRRTLAEHLGRDITRVNIDIVGAWIPERRRVR